jgi:hypothetical protein
MCDSSVSPVLFSFFFSWNLCWTIFLKYIIHKLFLSPRGVAWWQRAWDLHSRSRVRAKTCTSCKSLGQPEFYSLIWAHKICFPGVGFPRIIKKKKCLRIFEETDSLLYCEYKKSMCFCFAGRSIKKAAADWWSLLVSWF